MRTLGIIPARYASTRFPGKPLVEIKGISMVQRVYQQAQLSGIIEDIVVATDDNRILDHVLSFGGRAVMTGAHHQSGTDRCGEVIEMPGMDHDIIFNIQGDEPFIQPEQLQLLHQAFNHPDTGIATLVKKIDDPSDIENPNCVKATFTIDGNALYFSRSPIPFARNPSTHYFRHIGLYAYRRNILQHIIQLSPTELEKAESLEQLRWLENGFTIRVLETQLETIGIDTPEDLLKIS